ncbi:MAG: hypothetical protein ABIX01_17230 [Chitinophagaceae bacterium]
MGQILSGENIPFPQGCQPLKGWQRLRLATHAPDWNAMALAVCGAYSPLRSINIYFQRRCEFFKRLASAAKFITCSR